MATVVHIVGVSGSGKTWLCKHLSKVAKCVDTDDVFFAAYWATRRALPELTPGKKFDIAWRRAARIIRDKLIKQTKGVLVFAGITVPIARCKHGYFIELNKDDYPALYRRLALREHTKERRAASDMKKIIVTSKDPTWIASDANITAQRAGLPPDLKMFAHGHARMRAWAKKVGYLPLSQAEIAAAVRKLAAAPLAQTRA